MATTIRLAATLILVGVIYPIRAAEEQAARDPYMAALEVKGVYLVRAECFEATTLTQRGLAPVQWNIETVYGNKIFCPGPPADRPENVWKPSNTDVSALFQNVWTAGQSREAVLRATERAIAQADVSLTLEVEALKRTIDQLERRVRELERRDK